MLVKALLLKKAGFFANRWNKIDKIETQALKKICN